MRDRTHGYRVGTHRTDAGNMAYKVLRDFWVRNREGESDLDDEIIRDHMHIDDAKSLCSQLNADLAASREVAKTPQA